tara:strand:+ start:6096 stop:6218 length:123 start_codon:yes stop_codon:yes gene_type:complete
MFKTLKIEGFLYCIYMKKEEADLFGSKDLILFDCEDPYFN